MRVSLSVCVYMCTCTCVCVCVCVYIYIYTHTHTGFTHTLYELKLLFWMRLIVIIQYPAQIFKY